MGVLAYSGLPWCPDSMTSMKTAIVLTGRGGMEPCLSEVPAEQDSEKPGDSPS